MFETKRCHVTLFKRSDFEEVKEVFLNHEVRKYLGGIVEEKSIEAALDGMNNRREEFLYWVVREKAANHFMGLVSLDQHHDGVDTEISYQFLPKWWGAGYAAEVVQVIIHYALTELGLPKVIAETQTANTASCRLLERLGMNLEKTITRFGAEQAIYSIKIEEDSTYSKTFENKIQTKN